MADHKLPLYAGVDIGGTNIKVGLVSDDAREVAHESISTEQEAGPKAAAERVAECVERLVAKVGAKRADVAALGLASPGPMDLPSGMLLCPGNLPAWHNTPLRDLFASATGMPVAYENDANAAAFGEYW
ncbi:MAG: ROK family protein, partial [Lacipirellulaceae bacterium]